MTFDRWYELYSDPYETKEQAAQRYADEQGYENPAEKQGFLDSLPSPPDSYGLGGSGNLNLDTFGDWTPPAPEPSEEDDYISDPDILDSTGRGIDLMQANSYGIAEGPVSGFLDNLGFNNASKYVKDFGREGRERNLAEADRVAPAKSIEQELAENPDSWYKYADKDMMTAGQLAESLPTSIAPYLAAVPIAMAAPVLTTAAGITAAGTFGAMAVGAGTAMGLGNVASSAYVSAEAYERGKSDPVIREQLGIDPNKKFEDLPPIDQQKVDKVATDLSETSFGHRLYTAGLVEMASYIPYGKGIGAAIVRLGLDAGLGTTSELWDRTLYSEDAISALIENGIPLEKAEEVRQAIVDAGPSFREVLVASLQQELVMGAPTTVIEAAVTDHRVNQSATNSKFLKEEAKEAQKEFDKNEQKQIDFDRKNEQSLNKQEINANIQSFQQDQKAYDASLLEQQKANSKEDFEIVKNAQKLEQEAKDREGIEYDMDDSSAFYNTEGELTADFYGSDTEVRSAEEIEASLDKNLPAVIEKLEQEQAIIENSQRDYKKGSDEAKKATKRLADIDSKIKELTAIEAEKTSPQAKLKEREAILKEEKTLDNIEKKLFGSKGEGSSRFDWSAEKFNDFRFWKKRKLELDQRKKNANTPLRTQEQIKRANKKAAAEREKLAADLVDGKVSQSAVETDGDYTLNKEAIQVYLDKLGVRHPKYKGLFTLLSQSSPQNLANILMAGGKTNESGPRKGEVMNETESLAYADELMQGSNAFVFQGHVYVVAENMKGRTKKEATENLVKIAVFHEPITHLGLEATLGDDYNPFLDDFYRTNQKEIDAWLRDEAPEYIPVEDNTVLEGLTEEELKVHEAKEKDRVLTQKRIIAEEYLANKFVEFGILDPDIASKTADSLLNTFKGLLDPSNRRVSTVKAREILAEIQRTYLGGKKNIITGDFFDPANWSSKTPEIDSDTEPDKVQAYKAYLREQGIEVESDQTSDSEATTEAQSQSDPDIKSSKRPLKKGSDAERKAKRVKNPMYDSYYDRNDGVFFRGASEDGKGTGLGALGKGIYLSQDESMAGAFAARQGGKTKAYKIKDGLNIADADGTDVVGVKKEMGFEPWEYSDEPMFANYMTWKLKDKGYDGVMSGDRATGIVIFDDKNVKQVPKILTKKDTEEEVKATDFLIDDDDIKFSKRTKPDPKKTIKAYKLFQTKTKQPGKLFPLFIGATESVPVGQWQDADIKPTKGFTERPGWHLSDMPFALHIGTNVDTKNKPTVRPDNQVWAEIEVSDDVDWQPEANRRGKTYAKGHKSAGKLNPQTAEIKDAVPVDGNYRYKTNPNMEGQWIIGGSIKVSRILDDSEVKAINDKNGVADLPRKAKKGSDAARAETKVNKDQTIKSSKIKGTDEKSQRTETESTAKDRGKARKNTGQFDATPLPLDWIRDLEAESSLKNINDNIADRFGSNNNEINASSLKVYNLDTLIGTENKPNKKLDKLLKEKGFEVKIFSFDPARFKLPNFKKEGYFNGVLWIYDPAVDKASFHDVDYTKAWRVTHELGHAVTERFVQDKYGYSAREGRLGAKTKNYRGTPPKRTEVVIPALTLKEAQRAVEWEDVAFRAQRKVLEELGVKVSESDFIKEYNINIKGALHRIVIGDFDDPISNGFIPNENKRADLRGILELLETTEKQIAKAQGREATAGIDLKTWKPVSNLSILNAFNNPVLTGKPPARKGIKKFSDQSIRFSKRSLTDEETKTAEEVDTGKTKGSDEAGSSISGTTAKSPYEGRIDVESDGQSHFVHWSNSSDLTETDPSYYGTGIAGRERAKKKAYPDIFVPRTYVGLPGYSKEGGLGKNMYEIQLDPNTLYDIESTDRLDLWEQAVQEMGFDKAAYTTKFESLLKEAGYDGYFNKSHNVAALFNPTKLNFTKEIIGPSTYVPSIKDQSIKSSKRNLSAKELEAEWKKRNQPKSNISKKDKVTISKEARDIINSKPTRADLDPLEIMNPDGNVKTSKILASRAANFALNTRNSGEKLPLRYRISKKLTQVITPQGKLPERLKFLALRRLTKGKIQAIEEGTKTLYKVLRNTKQSSVIYDFFTTRDADPKKITNPAERKAAVDAKKTIDGIGQDLVNSGLLDAGAVAELKGMYLPNVYLKYLIPDKNSFVRVRKGGGVNIDQNYLKKRLTEEQLPKPIADLILGKIKDPAYLASKGISIPAKDMAILDFLQQIAGNGNWVSKDSLVKFNMLKEIKDAGLPLAQQKELGLIDTSGVNVSAHWLKNEAERIWNMTKYMNLDDTSKGIIEKVVKRMEDVAAPQLDKNYDSNVYTMVPKTKKYGMLAGMALRKEIAEDIFGNMDMTTGPISIAEKIIGDGGYLGDFNRFWKWSKVSANPPSWVRNFVSNMILMNMGGVSFLSMPKLILESLGEMKNKGGIDLLARDLGLTAGNFSNVELARIEREFKDLQVRLSKDGKGGPLKVFGMIKGAFNKIQDVTSDTYGGIDTLGKVMMLKDGLRKAGLKVKKHKDYTSKELKQLDDIAYNAEKWLFDYSNVLPSVKYLRNVPFGAPFASFTSFVAPLMLETAITKPWKFLPYYALGYGMKEMFKDEFELDEEQYEGFKVSMSEYLREKAFNSVFPRAVVPFPFLDENKRIQFMDVSYLYPWGMFSEVAGELGQGKVGDAIKTAGLLGSPGLNIASAIMTGIDPFSRKSIVDETGTPTEKAADLLWYAFNLSAPPMLHGLGQGPGQGFGAVKRLLDAHTGQLSKDGEAKFTKGQAWGRMFGMNVTPIAVPEGRTKHLKYEYSKLKKLEYTAKREIKNMIVMQASKKDIQEVIKEYAEKIGEAKKEFIEKIRISAPPMNLLRERETFLKKQRQKALAYKNS